MDSFDDKDPWHINADFLFGFQCERCDNEISLEDVQATEFSKQCVEMTDLAKKRGWKYLEEFKFICNCCANKK